MNLKKLTDAVQNYKNTGKDKEGIIRKIGILVYELLKDKYKMNEDDRSKFFCMYYRKIPGLVERFEYRGKPFELYLYSSLRWNIKTFRTIESSYTGRFMAIHRKPFCLTPETEIQTETVQTELKISETAKKVLNINTPTQTIPDANKIRLFFIYLIESEYLDERIRDGIIDIMGFNRNWVKECSEKLKTRNSERVRRIKSIQNRRNSYFLKIHILQEKYSFAENDSERDQLTEQISKLQYSIRRLNRIISRAMTHPTHREIAEILDLPKGTVDSGIYYIKNSFKKFESYEQKSA